MPTNKKDIIINKRIRKIGLNRQWKPFPRLVKDDRRDPSIKEAVNFRVQGKERD